MPDTPSPRLIFWLVQALKRLPLGPNVHVFYVDRNAKPKPLEEIPPSLYPLDPRD